MPSQPICVRRTNSLEEAELIVAWLDEQGVEARVIGRDNPGVFAFGVTDLEGVGVYVADEAAAARAKALLSEHDRHHDRAAPAAARAFEVTCEECGSVNTFSGDVRGPVQECSECGAYLDIPKGEDT